MAKVVFEVLIEKFAKHGEKTGWTYISIPFDIADQMVAGRKTSFRVKGTLDQLVIKGVAILPMGDGNFIMPLNGPMRKQLRKGKGEYLKVTLEHDKEIYQQNELLLECLQDDPDSFARFRSLPLSHQNYYSKYIDSAKTDTTKAKRIAQVLQAMKLNMSYTEMIKSNSAAKD